MKKFNFKWLLLSIILSIASINTAWAGYQEGKWGFWGDGGLVLTWSVNGNSTTTTINHGGIASGGSLGNVSSSLNLTNTTVKFWRKDHFGNVCSSTVYWELYKASTKVDYGDYSPASWGSWDGDNNSMSYSTSQNFHSKTTGPGNYSVRVYAELKGAGSDDYYDDASYKGCGTSCWYNKDNSTYYEITFTEVGFTTTSTSQAFDNTTVSSNSSKTISFGNHYGTTLTTSNCAITGTNASEFSVTSINETSVTVRFAPTTAGNKSATLTITDAHSKTCTITLSGKTQYTVTYNKGTYGTGSNKTANKVYGTDLTLRNSGDFSRTGYNHTAWNTNAAGTGGTSYSLGGSYTSEAAVTLYPTWTAKTYTVTLNKNGADCLSNGSATATYNSGSVTSATYPTYTDYRCDGYYTAADGGDLVLNTDGSLEADVDGYTDGSGNWTLDDDAVLYAHWTYDVTNYTVTYGVGTSYTSLGSLSAYNNSTSAALGASPQSVRSGQSVTFTASPNTGYTVDGWYTDEDCTKGKHDAGSLTYTTSVSGDLDVYVNFILKTTTITLDNTNSTTGATSVTATYSQSLPSFTAHTRTGYTLNGYYSASSGGTKVINADGTLVASVTISTVPYTNSSSKWIYESSTLTLYPQWTEKLTTVTIDASPEGTGTFTLDASAFSAGNTTTVGVTTGHTIVATAHADYSFDSWSVTGNATGTSSTNTYNLKGNGSAGTGTLTANFELIECKLYKLSEAKNGDVTDKGAMSYDLTNSRYYIDITTDASPFYFRFYHNGETAYSSDWSSKAGGDAYSSGKSVVVNGSKVDCESVESWGDKPNMYYSGASGSKIRIYFDKTNSKVWITASADERYVLRGSNYDESDDAGMPGWSATDSYFDGLASGNTGTITVALDAATKYKLKVFDMFTGTWYGNNVNYTQQEMSDNTLYTLGNNSDPNQFYFTSTAAGDYTFTYDKSSGAKLKVEFPTSYQVTYSALTVGSGSGESDNPSAETSASDAVASESYVLSGTTVTFTAAKAEDGYTWKGWYNTSTPNPSNWSTGRLTEDQSYETTISAATTIYAVYDEEDYSVTVSAGVGGRITTPASPATSVTAHPATTAAIVAEESTGYYFTGWTTEDAGITIADASSLSTTITATSAGTITANFAELEKIYFRNENASTKEILWDEDNIYVYFTVGWGKNGSEYDGVTTSGSTKYAQMAPISSGSKIYWAYVPHSFTTTIGDGTGSVAFSDKWMGSSDYPGDLYGTFFGNKGVYRTDYCKHLNMFVPSSTESKYSNSTSYYDDGFWMKYNTSAGDGASYYLKENTSSGELSEFKISAANGTSIVTTYDFNSTSKKKFYIANAAGNFYKANADIGAAACTNVTVIGDGNSGSAVGFYVTPTSEGKYTFMIDQSGDAMTITVEYPASKGDYRLLYTYDTDKTRTSDIIKFEQDVQTNKVSMYIDPTSGVSLKLQKCTGIDGGTKKPTWTTGVSVGTLSSVFTSGKGVYVFDISINNTGKADDADPTISLNNKEIYDGPYYIKTDCADGNWGNYKRNVLTENTINFDKANVNTFDYYYCKNVGSGTNVKFVIANDYNNAVSDTIVEDATYLTTSGGGTSKEYTPEASCIRFSYNSATNEAKRAYMRYSLNDNFLNVIPTAASKVYSDAEATSDLNGAGASTSKMSEDEGNFVYQKTVYSKSDGAINIQATYNSQNQTFASSGSMITSSGSGVYPIQVIYDFKTNNLTTAWYPGNDPKISDEISDVDYMYIRNGQDAADQLTFNGGSLENAKVCGVFQFDYSDYVGKVGAWPEQDGQADGYTYKKCMFYFSFPFDVNVSDIFGIGTYGKEWKIQYYDGEERAKKGFFRGDGTTTFWKDMPLDGTLEAYRGYSLLLDNDYFNTTTSGMVFEGKTSGSVYLYFPSNKAMSSITSTTKDVYVKPLTCELPNSWEDPETKNTLYHSNTDSHWNMLGVPLLNSQNGDFSTKFSQSGLSYLYAWDAASNTFSPAATGSDAGAVGNFTFQAMGAYMVQFTGTITFTGSVPTPASVAARQKKETKNYTIDLEVKDEEDARINHTYVELREGASDDFMLNEDMYMSLNSNAVNIYSFAGGYDVAANVLSVGNHVVSVGVAVKKAGTYKFSMPYEFSGTVTLIDKFNGERTNLAIEDYEVYLEQGSFNDRFDLEININKAPTAIDGVDGGSLKDGKAHKFIENGVMYILQNGRIYNAEGALVK